MKTTRLSALLTLLALLLTAAPAGALGKDKKKALRQQDDLAAFFVEEDRLLVSDWQGRLMILSYPDMEIVAELDSGGDRKLSDIAVSDNRKWLAARYKDDRLRVWDLATREPALTLEEGVTPTFRLHPEEDLLVVFQKKVGVTQWDLRTGTNVGPTIPDVVLGPGRMWIAPNGKYLAMEGICRADGDRWDQCIFDLRDGAIVAWADDPAKSTFFASERQLELLAEFNELVEMTGFNRTAPAPPGCERRADDGLLFCCSLASAVLTDENSEPEPTAEGGSGFKGFFKQAMEQNRPAEFPGRYRWKIAATNERKRFQINSCDLSEDGEWVVLGVNSAEVLLYSTGQLEPAALKLMGKWQQPVLASSFEPR